MLLIACVQELIFGRCGVILSFCLFMLFPKLLFTLCYQSERMAKNRGSEFSGFHFQHNIPLTACICHRSETV